MSEWGLRRENGGRGEERGGDLQAYRGEEWTEMWSPEKVGQGQGQVQAAAAAWRPAAQQPSN